MKRIKKILSVILCIFVVMSLFSGCRSKSDSIDFIYPFNADIKSFDPQIASTSDEFLIIQNCFEGLVRIRDDGTAEPGCAESWEVSTDGKTYTFKLKQGVKWRIKEDSDITDLMGEDFNPDITADDFVFAFQRAADSTTDSPLFSSIANIVNAAKIHSSKAKAETLGVKAIDDYTLEIKLNSADAGFMSILDTAVAMPCNRSYFNATKGRYGLGTGYTMFNGQFYVRSILESSYILKNNDLYSGSHPSAVTDITLNIINSESDIPKNLKNGYYDCAYITGKEYEALSDSKITVTPYTNKVWAFVLNKNRQIFSNSDLRQAVCLSVSPADTDAYSYMSNATCITPPSCIVGNIPADEAIGKTVYKQNTEKAVELWRKGLNEEKFTSANLTIIATEDMESIAKQLVQGIQGSIGKISSYGDDSKIAFSLKIDILSQKDFNAAYAGGDYDIALQCISSNSHNAVSFLKGLYDNNYFGESSKIEKAIDNAQRASASNQAQALKTAEQEMLKDYSVLPVLFESSYYAQAKGVSGVDFHAGSGRISFVYAQREN
ncbi:MAG: peptide ABC transporter substrate-binding protein [Clostridium sp.]|nr:peptide ABC transporter substrate-binding protein [Clostridium sp.]